MNGQLRLSELRNLSDDEREKKIADFINDGPLYAKENTDRLRSRLMEYEEEFNMTTAELHVGLSSGQIEETAEMAKWLIIAGAVKRANEFEAREGNHD